jgi:hypothetical protein
MTEEQKEKMAAGRERAKQERLAELAAAAAEAEDADAVETAEPEPDEAALALQARRANLLQGVPADIAALISDEELDAIEAEERAKAEQERKKQALASVRGALRQIARVENDLISPDVLRSDAERARLMEPVTFRVSVPLEGSGNPAKSPAGLRVDGFFYQHGQTYTRPRAVADSIREMMYRVHLAELTFRTLDQDKIYGRGDAVVLKPAQILMARSPMQFEVAA